MRTASHSIVSPSSSVFFSKRSILLKKKRIIFWFCQHVELHLNSSWNLMILLTVRALAPSPHDYQYSSVFANLRGRSSYGMIVRLDSTLLRATILSANYVPIPIETFIEISSRQRRSEQREYAVYARVLAAKWLPVERADIVDNGHVVRRGWIRYRVHPHASQRHPTQPSPPSPRPNTPPRTLDHCPLHCSPKVFP